MMYIDADGSDFWTSDPDRFPMPFGGSTWEFGSGLVGEDVP